MEPPMGAMGGGERAAVVELMGASGGAGRIMWESGTPGGAGEA